MGATSQQQEGGLVDTSKTLGLERILPQIAGGFSIAKDMALNAGKQIGGKVIEGMLYPFVPHVSLQSPSERGDVVMRSIEPLKPKALENFQPIEMAARENTSVLNSNPTPSWALTGSTKAGEEQNWDLFGR